MAVETNIFKEEKKEQILWQKVSSGAFILLGNKMMIVCLGIVVFWFGVALLAPLLTPYSPTKQDWKAVNQGPSIAHPLGTDELGRDLWSRLIYGARVVLIITPVTEKFWLPGGVALWGVFVSLAVGCTLGLLSGYKGGWLDEILMRLVDAMMAIPYILFYLLIVTTLGISVINVVFAISITATPSVARLTRGLTLDIRTRDYIRSAETRGESFWYIVFIEILPNARGPILVDSMFRMGWAIFALGTLGFLGLGLPPPSPDWGSMIAKGRAFILVGSPWAAFWPSVAIASLVVALNLLADELRTESMKYQ
jgi:peptide/nickel transport system permease protein